MATSLEDLNPLKPFAISVSVKAKPGKADELAQWMANLKARADSNVEPGTLRYDIVRYGDVFAIWEEYTNPEALKEHSGANDLYKEVMSLDLSETLLATFFPADSLPAPALKF
ncbi:hypothetical protein M0805_005856 [Coniferiporia weirii]|nr:hypothetical protein M0805_005856 [Coniferiporia weirii]